LLFRVFHLTIKLVSLLVDILSPRILVAGYTVLLWKINNNRSILAELSPNIKRCQPGRSIKGRGYDRMLVAPRVVHQDIDNVPYIQFSDSEFWYGNYNSNIQIKNCNFFFQFFYKSNSDLMPSISKCSAKSCKTLMFWLQLIKLETTLSLFVRLTSTTVSGMKLELILLLKTLLTLQLLTQKMKIFTTFCPF
jgi:hypothetical protein